jgi:hypothetical protein
VTKQEERRRWCVEQAIKWPQIGSASMMSGGGYADADIIGRAKQLETYLTEKSETKQEPFVDNDQLAAEIISDFLVQSLSEAERSGRHLYEWERNGIEWLREHWRRSPDTPINMWTADRYVLNDGLDLYSKMSATK